MKDIEPTNLMLSCHYGPKSLANIPSTSKVYLMKFISVYTMHIVYAYAYILCSTYTNIYPILYTVYYS